MKNFENKKVVIIGGTSGIGLSTAKMLLDGGARVLVTGRSQAGLDLARKEIGKDAIIVSSDARSLTDLDALAVQAKAEFGTLDFLFINAGFSLFVDIPRGLTRLFRALWITELCRQLRKSQLIINKLKWSKCNGINCLLFRNEVINGPGMST